ncbi:MAG: histidine phosphatase family protein [Actinobacteria bacterium]|nr:histidine phosphatase family protein [Actinomycetota bacterium]NIS37142.1 histidine phosphatase family protein [Actinomycetota bacterium]NIT99104.1 histidine phosphatase family protein [Actinomycetota bacterium]NIU22716.1 histidine phosphatase family protein [Actinomycetota bacterium]NIU71588.1 histidine phosphatase family protein [Actinomycetota bacterium]
MLDVLIARHAQSVWNAQGRWQGQADPPLSESGRAQARAAARQCGGFDAIVASDLERAADTARILAETVGIGPVITDTAFRERHAGEFQGLTRTEIDERFPGHLDNGRWPPGWEPDESVRSRVLEGMARVREEVTVGQVLVVAHGGVIYSLEAHLGAPHERIPNLGGRWFHHLEDRWELGVRVQLSTDDVTVGNRDVL